jgi:hypothetical protein
VRKLTNTGLFLYCSGTVNVTVAVSPDLGTAGETLREGKALKGSAGLEEGHDLIKPAARVKTWLKSIGVYHIISPRIM